MHPRITGGYDLTMSLDLSFENDRGQVGIGTLIVFIAMVLVAAIAAGVLINTAGFLQDSAEQTGEEAQTEVTDRLDIESVTGAVNDEDDAAVNDLTVTVSPEAGAGPIDLDDVTVSYFDAEEGVDDTLTDEEFDIEPVTGFDGNNNVMTDAGDKAELGIAIVDDDVLDTTLEENDDAELTVDVAGGGDTTTTIEVPILTGNEERVILG